MIERESDRGQLVLLAAALLVVALVPLAFAYLQLGYHDDIVSGGDHPIHEGERTLEHGVHDAAVAVDSEFDWTDREQAVETFRAEFATTREAVATAQLDSGIAYDIAYNGTAGADWEADNCPGGADRQFGDCETIDGVVVQERRGQTQILAVALDMWVTTPTQEMRTTTVVEFETE